MGSCSKSANFLEGVVMSSTPTQEERSAAANKSHSEAERRRRKRINGHLATLRSLLPSTIKPDKASLLAEVVRSIREMKAAAAELAASSEILPAEVDELKLCYCEGNSLIKAAICCEDRPELITEVARAVRGAEGRVVRAEMATVGGRTKSLLWVEFAGGSGGEEGLLVLRRALRIGLDRAALSGQVLPGSKRSRLSHY